MMSVHEQVGSVGGYPKIMDGSGAFADILSSGVAACQSSILPIDRVLTLKPTGANTTAAVAPAAPTTLAVAPAAATALPAQVAAAG